MTDAPAPQALVSEETLRNTLADHFARHDIRELDIRMLRNQKLLRSRLPEYCLAALEALESALTAPARQVEVQALIEALEPFAVVLEEFNERNPYPASPTDDQPIFALDRAKITWGHLRRASQVLARARKEG